MQRITCRATTSALVRSAQTAGVVGGSGAASLSSYTRAHQQHQRRMLSTEDAPAMPPGYVPIDQRPTSDESLRFTAAGASSSATAASAAPTTATATTATANANTNTNDNNAATAVATTKAGRSTSTLSTERVWGANSHHLAEGYVREDGKILTRRGDGEGAILEFVDPLPPTKLGQLKKDVVNKDTPSTPSAMREAAVKAYVAKDTITRRFGAESREDFIEKVDAAQQRGDEFSEQQKPLYHEDGRKALARDTARGFRSVDGGKTLFPHARTDSLRTSAGGEREEEDEGEGHRDSNGNGNDNGRARDDEGTTSSPFSSSSSSPSSPTAAAAASAIDEEQAAALAALRDRRKSRSRNLFSNISTMNDDDESTKVKKPLPIPPVGGFQSFVRYDKGSGDDDGGSVADNNIRKFDPFQQRLREEKRAAEAAKAASSRSIFDAADGNSNNAAEGSGDVLAAHLKAPKGNYASRMETVHDSTGVAYEKPPTTTTSASSATSASAYSSSPSSSHHTSHTYDEGADDADTKMRASFPPSSFAAASSRAKAAAAHQRHPDDADDVIGDEAQKISGSSASKDTEGTKVFDGQQYRRDLEELEYYFGTPQFEEKRAALEKKYDIASMPESEKAKYRAKYTPY